MRNLAIVFLVLLSNAALGDEPSAQRLQRPLTGGQVTSLDIVDVEKIRHGDTVRYRLSLEHAAPADRKLHGKRTHTLTNFFVRDLKTSKRILSENHYSASNMPGMGEEAGILYPSIPAGEYELFVVVSGAIESDAPTVLDIARRTFTVKP